MAVQSRCHEIPHYKVAEVIRKMSVKISNTRQWYAVFRPMVDKGVYDRNDYDAFVWQVHEVVPEHAHLPTVTELRRMAVDSFAKPVSLWLPHKAPVSGKRFEDYLHLANLTHQCLDIGQGR